jgi:hypothetical protein
MRQLLVTRQPKAATETQQGETPLPPWRNYIDPGGLTTQRYQGSPVIRLQPLARAALAGDPEAPKALAAAAEKRAAELREYPRIAPETESLRFFCGMLRVIFGAAASPSMDRAWHNCARFALEVFAVAGIKHADFDAHPERLKEYLATDVTSD